MGNLMLQFPELDLDDFLRWIDASEATRRGLAPDQSAAMAATWRQGIRHWGQSAEPHRSFE